MSLGQARDWIAGARSLAALTGAGISAESGVPTFRGAGGLWKEYRADDLATPEAFARDPCLVWEWYEWRRNLIARARPNPGHIALAGLERRQPRFTLITQNVDDLHERAGSRRVVKLHGDIWQMRCTGCGAEWDDHRTPLPGLPPRCGCGALARPGVVWFGEALPLGVLETAQHAAMDCDVFLVAGTSAIVYPAASLIPLARRAGAKVVEINPERTAFSELVDCSLPGPAGELLPQLVPH